jgi:hypothetical protein
VEDEHADEVFTVPLPPPFPPHPGGERDVVFFRREVPTPEGRREGEDIMLRKVPADIARRFRTAAGGRGLTHAQYLAALVELHESLRALADAGEERVAGELERLGLATVRV